MMEGMAGGSAGSGAGVPMATGLGPPDGVQRQRAAWPERVKFEFSGTAGEYFQIWIVNIALSVLTLGIYSAWAKVRTKQYFYRHTNVGGSSFDYLADPLSILKGRLIIAGFLGLMAASQYVSVGLYGLMALVFLLATPFLMVQSLKFTARNSALRNMRFSFAGTVGEGYGVILLAWVLPIITCGLAYPYVIWRLTQFIATRHLYGDERFDWTAKAGQYYKLFLVPLLAQLALIGLLGVVIGATRGNGDAKRIDEMQGLVLATLALIYPAMFALGAYLKARSTNLVYNHLSIGPHRLECNQRARDLLGLYFLNAVAVLFSLGLMVPWAKIRLAQYKADHLTLLPGGPLVVGSNPLAEGASPLGDAATDLGDIGFDFGL